LKDDTLGDNELVGLIDIVTLDVRGIDFDTEFDDVTD
jgi:hypothetical protein